ncbi:WecB/TagA/CpsF family glycosyltransferase [Novosphingobium sp. RD2P27]|uniref:WecB/TagA/CpsF family glycosyltransferase n=1 Tax=Novosphingobium kalidii TaxID=3230299 RepID=A0ABV2CWN3_9SPHN
MSHMTDFERLSASAQILPERVLVGGLPTVRASRKELAAMMVADCQLARDAGGSWLPKLVFSSNGQGVALAGMDDAFRDVMLEASWIHADGQSVVFASKMTAAPLPERIATTDFFHDAARAAIEGGLSFYIFGGSENQNRNAVERIRVLYPELKIVGRRNGYFDPAENNEICQDIRESGADVLWVGLGKPRQEEWCVRNRDQLRGIGWVKTCGGLYAFLSGEAPRAPDWMQSLGLEWLFRAMRDPKRLLWRYLTTNPYSIYRLIRYTNAKSI